MSALNGDKSRYNRERKQKLARRKRTQEMMERAAKAVKTGGAPARVQPEKVSG